MRDSGLIERIFALVAEFGKGLSRPEQKFLQDMVFGILCSQSSLLSEISRVTATESDVKNIYKRLDKNLGYYDLSFAFEKAQRKMTAKIDSSYLLIFDPSEIVKPFAKKMEGLALVRDASEKPRLVKDEKTGKRKEVPVLKPGFCLRVAVGISSCGDVLPVDLQLYSSASEFFISNNDEHIQALETLLHRTGLEPTLVLDREFDSFVMIRHLCQLRVKFIIRMKSNRKFKPAGTPKSVDGPTYTREQMIDDFCFLKTTAQIAYTEEDGSSQEFTFSFSASHVELLSEFKKSEDIRDHDDTQALTLVQMQIHKEDGTPTLYLLTTKRPQTQSDLEEIGRAYLSRWNIEEYIRFLKQHFSLEDFLVRDLGRMKNLIRAVYITTVILHILTDRNTVHGFKTHHHLIQKSLEVTKEKKFKDFYLYNYGRGLSRIVAVNKKLLKTHDALSKKSNKNHTMQLGLELN